MYMYIPSLSLFFFSRHDAHSETTLDTRTHRTQRGKNIQYANNQKKRRAGRFHSVSSFLKHASSQSPPQHPHEWCRQIKTEHTRLQHTRAFANAKTQFVHDLDNLLPCDNKKSNN